MITTKDSKLIIADNLRTNSIVNVPGEEKSFLVFKTQFGNSLFYNQDEKVSKAAIVDSEYFILDGEDHCYAVIGDSHSEEIVGVFTCIKIAYEIGLKQLKTRYSIENEISIKKHLNLINVWVITENANHGKRLFNLAISPYKINDIIDI